MGKVGVDRNKNNQNQFRKQIGSLLIGLLLLLTGCEQAEAPVRVTSARPSPTLTATIQPTPTLHPAVNATATPPPIPTITFTPSATSLPSATPAPAERLVIAEQAVQNGDSDSAAIQLQAAIEDDDSGEIDTQALLQLGRVQFNENLAAQTIDTFTRLLVADPTLGDAHYYLAQSFQALGNCDDAILHYQQFITAEPTIAAYIHPLIAQCHHALDDDSAAEKAWLQAQNNPAHIFQTYQSRLQLIDIYTAQGDNTRVADITRRIRDAATTEYTRAQMTVQLGDALIAAGESDAGYEQYRIAINDFPTYDFSHQALIKLLDAGYPIDEFQRGVVDYHAAAYTPAVEAFLRDREQHPNTFRDENYLWLAWSYAGLGDVDAAIAELDAYAALSVSTTATGLYEKARLYHRQGLLTKAMDVYEELALTLPASAEAPDAAWQAAQLQTDPDLIAITYINFAETHPDHPNASQALYLAALEANQPEQARALWTQAAELAPYSDYGQAAIAQLITADATNPLNTQFVPGTFYGTRIWEANTNSQPFTPPALILLKMDAGDQQLQAENWLRQQLEIGEGVDIRTLSNDIATLPAYQRGQLLWRIGRYEDAKFELESVRRAFSDDPLSQYQLALAYRDLGLYRSAILAAFRVMILTESNVVSAPPFIAKLAYPIYYADLIPTLAQEFGYDPLLQFALIRQESLFESFATSGAAAQGLAQVIPDTGTYIAAKLGMANYVNDDLYRPYIGLRFGGYYLAEQLALFDQFEAAALAAYNAGPGNANRWYQVAGDDLDLYYETINFPETKLYIERIYSGYAIYRYLYQAVP